MGEHRYADADPRLVVEAMTRKDAGDLEGFLALFTPDCEIVFPGATLRGIQEWRQFVSAYFDAFPDGRYEVARLEPVGQTVFAEGCGGPPTPGPCAPPRATSRRPAGLWRSGSRWSWRSATGAWPRSTTTTTYSTS